MNEFFFLLHVLVLFNEHMFLLTIKEIKSVKAHYFQSSPSPVCHFRSYSHGVFCWSLGVGGAPELGWRDLNSHKSYPSETPCTLNSTP